MSIAAQNIDGIPGKAGCQRPDSRSIRVCGIAGLGPRCNSLEDDGEAKQREGHVKAGQRDGRDAPPHNRLA